MQGRYYAFVRYVANATPQRQFVGLPPELTGGTDNRVALPRPQILVATSASDTGVMLDRYTATGEAAGDTWHENMEDAKQQADFEYGDAVGEWREVPDVVADAVAFALAEYRETGGNKP